MKLKDLKEWGGRDLPGFGDEATWGGRTPYGSDDDDNYERVSVDELANEYMFLDPHVIAKMNDEAEIHKYLEECGFDKVVNDTGHPFVQAIKYALRPMEQALSNGNYIPKHNLNDLAKLGESLPPEMSITQIQATAKQWVNLAEVE